MNLQVCVPYEECPFKCPMCVANGRKKFNNLYKSDRDRYLQKLDTLGTLDYDCFIITGGTEPTLNKEWVEEAIVALGRNVELQTKNYNLKGYDLYGLNTLAYSITKPRELRDAWKYRKIDNNNRLVILLTKDFNYLNVENFSTMGFNQITFKVLQLTADKKTNEWIEENRMTDLSNIYKIVDHYNGNDISVRLDSNCQDSHGRYEVFREDGKTYKSWED